MKNEKLKTEEVAWVLGLASGGGQKTPSVQAPTSIPQGGTSTKWRAYLGGRATWLKNMKLRNEPILKTQ